MPVVPEKLTSRQEVRNAISSQFWEQPMQSTRSIDGLVRTLPGEPTPLSQTASSGLVRTQQLIAFQSLGVPFFPSYNKDDGGVVLDRVLGSCGSRTWWVALGSRVRAQRIWKQCQGGLTKKQAFMDLGNYALCTRARWALTKDTTFNCLLELPDLRRLADARHPAAARDWAALRGALLAPSAAGCRAWVRQLLPGHELRAGAAWQSDAIDSSASYMTMPFAAAVDVASQERSDGLQYRAGLHQVSAPAVEGRDWRRGEVAEGRTSMEAAAPWHTSLHFQGSVAVEGEAMLWRPAPRNGLPPANSGDLDGDLLSLGDSPSPSVAAGPASAGPAQTAAAAVALLPAALGDVADVAAAGAGEGHQRRSGGAVGRRPSVGLRGGGGGGAGSCCSGDAGAGSGEAAWNGIPVRVVAEPLDSDAPAPAPDSAPRAGQQAAALRSGSVGWQVADAGEDGFARLSDAIENLHCMLEAVRPDAIQSGLQRAITGLEGARGKVDCLASQLRSSAAANRDAPAPAPAPAPRRKPYSPFLAEPFVKINAAMGCLARIPLPHRAFPRSLPASAAGADGRSAKQRMVEAWAPYLKDTALRVFASGSLSAQVGSFKRLLLDYTALTARLDLGLTSMDFHATTSFKQRVADAAGGAFPSANGSFKHRAFALEGRGTWHALSVSAAQQVVGPLRARVDARFALDPTLDRARAMAEGVTWRGVATMLGSVRPTLLETVYGADCVLPGSHGAARLAVWWSPMRKEAMAEIRLF